MPTKEVVPGIPMTAVVEAEVKTQKTIDDLIQEQRKADLISIAEANKEEFCQRTATAKAASVMETLEAEGSVRVTGEK